MSDGLTQLNFPVKDVSKEKKLVGALLGVEPYMEQAYYVGFRVGGVEIGLDPNGHAQGFTGPVPYRQVDDIDATVKALLEAGGQPHQAPRDVGAGKLVATVRDADGNTIGLIQPR